MVRRHPWMPFLMGSAYWTVLIGMCRFVLGKRRVPEIVLESYMHEILGFLKEDAGVNRRFCVSCRQQRDEENRANGLNC